MIVGLVLASLAIRFFCRRLIRFLEWNLRHPWIDRVIYVAMFTATFLQCERLVWLGPGAAPGLLNKVIGTLVVVVAFGAFYVAGQWVTRGRDALVRKLDGWTG